MIKIYPHIGDEIISQIQFQQVPHFLKNDDQSKKAFLWIITHFSQKIENSPYLVEWFVDNYFQQSSSIKIQILSSCAHIFFLRPSETFPILQRLIKLTSKDEDLAVSQNSFWNQLLLQLSTISEFPTSWNLLPPIEKEEKREFQIHKKIDFKKVELLPSHLDADDWLKQNLFFSSETPASYFNTFSHLQFYSTLNKYQKHA